MLLRYCDILVPRVCISWSGTLLRARKPTLLSCKPAKVSPTSSASRRFPAQREWGKSKSKQPCAGSSRQACVKIEPRLLVPCNLDHSMLEGHLLSAMVMDYREISSAALTTFGNATWPNRPCRNQVTSHVCKMVLHVYMLPLSAPRGETGCLSPLALPIVIVKVWQQIHKRTGYLTGYSDILVYHD